MATEAIDIEQSVSSRNEIDLTCPRCGGDIWLDGEEPRCIHCGYRDYSYTPPKPLKQRGMLDVVRYAGPKASLEGKVARVRWIANERGDDMQATVSCPYCPRAMARTKKSAWPSNAVAELHVCDELHSLTLIHTDTGALRWL